MSFRIMVTILVSLLSILNYIICIMKTLDGYDLGMPKKKAREK